MLTYSYLERDFKKLLESGVKRCFSLKNETHAVF